MFLEYEAVVVGKDAQNHVYLVEAHEGFRKKTAKEAEKQKEKQIANGNEGDDLTFGEVPPAFGFRLVAAVANSGPPRSETTADNARGAFVFGTFMLLVLVQSAEVDLAAPFQNQISQGDVGVGVQGASKRSYMIKDADFALWLLFIAALGVLARAITFKQAMASINLPVIVVFAFSETLKKCMKFSHCDQLVGEAVKQMANGSVLLTLVILYGAVTALTNFVNNVACAVMLHASIYKICQDNLISAKPMLTILVVASVSNFMTPVGCAQNLLVQVPGGYSFGDYVKGGAVLQLLFLLTTVSYCYMWIEADRASTAALGVYGEVEANALG